MYQCLAVNETIIRRWKNYQSRRRKIRSRFSHLGGRLQVSQHRCSKWIASHRQRIAILVPYCHGFFSNQPIRR
ncbi:hypothetical protein BD309DRAFT_671616 [Dichomitus squalens]|nr:hypothetical protein BD309DRAFT_671616 [Dichomitus squalens]